ncbi:porin [Propionivibrio sp.]|uniref:porin n=1 Tax=Propionivibrio sp. TaxID=2212460 RepID=UPI0025D06BC5|nr:porin [Propionivibrio sp.]MBK7354615.1 porin [Propionivibrio sp.]
MQKKLIALAVAGLASGAAFAQTNVTIYGVADATFEVASAKGAANSSNVERGSFTRVNTNSSLIGFKGEEALGNGLKAIFQFESGASFDSAGALSLARDSFVGLSGDKWGTVKLGNITGPTRYLGAVVDLNAGATGPGANASLIGKTAGSSALGAANATNSGVFDTRLTNTIAYATPTWSGFNAVAAYSSGENKSLDSATANATINTRVYDIGGFYNNGPIFVGLTYGQLNNNLDSANTNVAGTATLDKTSIWRLAGAYTFTGGHKITGLYERNKNNYERANVGTDLRRNIWGIGGKFMVTSNGGLIAQYYQAQSSGGDFLASNRNTGAKLYEIGYEHSLSKRTMLKASYSRLNNNSNSVYDFNVGAVGGGFAAGSDPTVWAAGIRHTF